MVPPKNINGHTLCFFSEIFTPLKKSGFSFIFKNFNKFKAQKFPSFFGLFFTKFIIFDQKFHFPGFWPFHEILKNTKNDLWKTPEFRPFFLSFLFLHSLFHTKKRQICKKHFLWSGPNRLFLTIFLFF